MTLRGWFAVLGVGLLAGCGEAGAGGTETGGAASSSGGATAAGGGSGDRTSSSSGEEVEGPFAAPLRVQLNWFPLTTPAVQTLGVDGFRLVGVTDPPLGESNCERVEVGACSAIKCPVEDIVEPPVEPPVDPNLPLTFAHAGPITAHFETTGDAMVADATVTPDAEGHYATSAFTGDIFAGEELGTISAEGGELPGFELAVDVPLLLLLTAPTAPGGTLTASRQADLSLTWDRGAVGTYLTLQPYTWDDGDPDYNYSLGCTFESSAGAGTIDADVLSAVPAGFEGKFLTVRVFTANPGADQTKVLIVSDLFDSTKTDAVTLTLTD